MHCSLRTWTQIPQHTTSHISAHYGLHVQTLGSATFPVRRLLEAMHSQQLFSFPCALQLSPEEPSEVEQWTETSLKMLTAIITPKGKNGKRRWMNVLHTWWKLKASTKSCWKICNKKLTILNEHWKLSPKISAQKSWSNQNSCKAIKTCFANRALRKEDCTEMLSRKIWWNVTTVKYMCIEKMSSRDCVMLLINCSLQSFYTCWEAYTCGQKNIVLQRCTTEFLCSSEKVGVSSTQWYEKSVTDGYHLIATIWVPESR